MIRIFVLFLFLVPAFVWSQGAKVDVKNFDSAQLNKYILKEVNSLRKRKRLDTLINDPILEKAAIDQAQYMAAEDVIGHGQKSKQKGSPYKRVLLYDGAHNLIGENVQAYDLAKALKKSKNRLTYDRLARNMVKIWAKSKPDNVNLLEAAYANVGHAYVLKNGLLFTCQVFGSKPFVEKYKFTKAAAVASKDGLECRNCRRVRDKIYNDEVSLGWYTVSNDSVYYWNLNSYVKGRFYRKKSGKYLMNTKRNNLNQVFKANGVLTIDVIHNEQFDCNGKPSFHNSPYHNGYYIGSLNKATVISQDIHPSPELVQVFVGMKPAFLDTFYQVDFHLLKKQRNCIQTSTIYVTPDYFKPSEYFRMPNPKITLDKNLIVEDSVIIKIPFERNQTSEDTSIFRPLITTMDSLIKDEHQIETIYFTGVASIEGTLKANRKLFLRRGAIIEDYLKRYYPDVPFQSEFYENFDDFRSGLVAAGYVDATEISNDTLRMFANDNRDDKEIAAALDQSRFSTIKVIYRDYFPIEEGSYGLSVQRIKDLIAEDKVSEVVPLYLVMANKVISGESIQREELLNFKFPKSPEFAKLHWYSFLLELAATDLVVDSKRLNELKELGAIKSDAEYLEFRLLFNLFNRNEAIDVSDMGEVLTTVRAKKQKAWIESLALILAVENGRTAPDIATATLLDNVLKRKFELNQTYFICQYLIQWGYSAEPYVLLSKFARRSNEIPKLYLQYLKLGYFLQQFEKAGEWKKIKVVIKNLAENHPEDFCNLFKWDEMGVRSLEKKEIAELFCEKCGEVE
ncbi:MAG: hypothetical protein GQ574_20985 [Crocinitomix sp.]|nr:hypothetical protein [Crocinitomix sp.]